MSLSANFRPGSLPNHRKPKPISHAEHLWSFLEECAFFSTTSGETFLAPDPNEAPGLLVSVNHPSCRQFLCQQYSRRFDSIPPPGALRSALARAHDSARAAALRDFSPALRIASVSKPAGIVIRHGHPTSHWQITTEGAFATTSRDVFFYAGRGARPLPQPAEAPASALDDFFHLLRVPSGPARIRCLTWLLSAFRPSGPYPILILRGPSGSGKSFAARALRALTDPNDTPLHPLPPSANQLRRLAYENWVLAFDHLTRFPRRTTESLARLTENEVHYLPPKRDPAAVSLARPVLLTVSDSCHIPPEIAARALTVELLPMPDAERKTEAELQTELAALLPQALTRVLKAVGQALKSPHRTFPLPRLADAAAWTIAAAPALGLTEPEILQALCTPPDPLVERIAALMQNLETWRGSATQLAADLNLDCDPSQLSRQLFQSEAALNALGLAITRSHGRLTRAIEITRLVVGPGFQPAAGLLPGATPQPCTSPGLIPDVEITELDKNLANAVTPSPADPLPAGTDAPVAPTVLPPPSRPHDVASNQFDFCGPGAFARQPRAAPRPHVPPGANALCARDP
jgi:hypothetical protein